MTYEEKCEYLDIRPKYRRGGYADHKHIEQVQKQYASKILWEGMTPTERVASLGKCYFEEQTKRGNLLKERDRVLVEIHYQEKLRDSFNAEIATSEKVCKKLLRRLAEESLKVEV